MARSDTTSRIAAPPSRVWVFFQPDKLSLWYGPEVTLVTPGPLKRGSQIRLSGGRGSKQRGYDATVTEYAENRSLTWEGSDGRNSYRVAFLITPKEGQTVILLRDEFHVKTFLGRLVERMMIGRVVKADTYFLERLKRLVENK